MNTVAGAKPKVYAVTETSPKKAKAPASEEKKTERDADGRAGSAKDLTAATAMMLPRQQTERHATIAA